MRGFGAAVSCRFGSGSVYEIVNHQGHEGTGRKYLRPKALAGVLGGSVSCRLHRETDPLPPILWVSPAQEANAKMAVRFP